MPHRALNLTQVQTYPLAQRRNLVHLEDLIRPEGPVPPFDDPQLVEVADRIVQARRAGRPAIWMMGAPVVTSGLSPLVIDLLQRGVITHVAGDGAVSIHDFELALIGQTSEETGALMHRAIRQGARDGLGYGEALGRFIAEEECFRHREVSILYQAYRLGVPVTIHVALGTDIIPGHPACDFAALGWASGQDFKAYCAAVADLEGGVFLNFGPAAIGPEVFLKALSIARNLGHRVEHFTTAHFDLLDPGEDYHIVGYHRATIPNLHHQLVARLGDELARRPLERGPQTVQQVLTLVVERSSGAARALRGLLERYPELECAVVDLARAYVAIARSQGVGGTLFPWPGQAGREWRQHGRCPSHFERAPQVLQSATAPSRRPEAAVGRSA